MMCKSLHKSNLLKANIFLEVPDSSFLLEEQLFRKRKKEKKKKKLQE